MSLLASYFYCIQDLLPIICHLFDHLLWVGQLSCGNPSQGRGLSSSKLLSPSQKIFLTLLCGFVLVVQKTI